MRKASNPRHQHHGARGFTRAHTNIEPMMLPYFTTNGASIAMAEANPDGSWKVQGVLNRECLQAEVFRQMFSPQPQQRFRDRKKFEPYDWDLHAELKAGTRTARILHSKDEVKNHNEAHPHTLYINKHGWVMRFQDFPLGWSGNRKDGEKITAEANEDWSLPLLAIDPN